MSTQAREPRDTDCLATLGTLRRQRVLMLTHRVPYPLNRGDRIRAYHMLERLSRHCDVSLACVSDEPVTPTQEQALRPLVRRLAIERISSIASRLRGIAALATGQAVTPACFYRDSLAETLADWHAEAPFDAVLTFCTGMIGYTRALRRWIDWFSPRNQPRQVLDLVDVDSAKWAECARRTWSPMRLIYQHEARRLRQIETGRFDPFAAISVVSEAEAKLYRRRVGAHAGLTVLRQAVDTDYFTPLPDSRNRALVFIGALDYGPNVEGLSWFVQHVFPLLRQQFADVKLRIVGRGATRQVRRLAKRYAAAGVELIGAVSDVRERLAAASAVIAPMQRAPGVATKVLEAMASARAVVCSPAAACGIEADPGTHLLIADKPHEWAYKLGRVLCDDSFRRRIARAARQRIEDRYAWQQCLDPLVSFVTGESSSTAAPVPLRKVA